MIGVGAEGKSTVVIAMATCVRGIVRRWMGCGAVCFGAAAGNSEGSS